MVEKYILNGDKLPTLPTPHDCEIVEIVCKDNFLIFKFCILVLSILPKSLFNWFSSQNKVLYM